jgi:hypothetical protein
MPVGRLSRFSFLTVLGLAFPLVAQAQIREAAWAPVTPGKPHLIALKGTSGARVSLANRALTATFDRDGHIGIRNLYTGESLKLEVPTTLTLLDGSALTLTNRGLSPVAKSGPGVAVVYELESDAVKVTEKFALQPGEHFLRITIDLTAKGPQNIGKIVGVLGSSASAKVPTVVGTVPGSPVVAGSFFCGLAHPMSVSATTGQDFTCAIERKVPLEGSVTYLAVVGVAPEGQMRRSVAAYVEDTRPRPYKPFLHYNSWYDIGYFTPYTEKDALNRINAFGQELSVKRGVKLSSYLFDDGWDDQNTIWGFSKDFPSGFLPLKEAAAKYGAGPGVWLSPWGGYGGPRERRLATGKKAGMEIDDQGYALSGPKYYDLFHAATMNFVKTQGINQFKFDGTGSPDKHTPGSKFDSDFAAAIALIQDLRQASGGKLFINLTTGTWPSPFWSQFADSIWRGGEDHSFAGVGTKRQQWMTYRDGDTYHGVVEAGPLYPINSLMLHGLIYAQHAQNLTNDPGDDFTSDVRAYFSTGTQLEEMYVTPSLLTPANWDVLATTAKWAAANASVLQDVHWIGGDPMKLEVYGHAAWSPKKTIVELRNPSDHLQAYSLNLTQAAELPTAFAKGSFSVKEAFGGSMKMTLDANQSSVIRLAPFQVLILEITPVKK